MGCYSESAVEMWALVYSFSLFLCLCTAGRVSIKTEACALYITTYIIIWRENGASSVMASSFLPSGSLYITFVR